MLRYASFIVAFTWGYLAGDWATSGNRWELVAALLLFQVWTVLVYQARPALGR